MMGSEIYLHITAVDRDVVLRLPTTDLPLPYRTGIPYGEKLRFTFRPEMLHLFDPQTEANLIF